MIPHKNLFIGALGKLQNIGGSRIYTTPHTVSVPAEYSINVSYNVQGDLVGHSLDGRLWFYRRSRRLGIIALKWNVEKGELEYAVGQNISNNDDVVLACGIDWVLTNNNIFMVSDEEPYIRSTRLFDANIPDTFLYSILRDGNIGMSGIDPFTGEAWGKREDNGNSEGTGYFSKSTHLLYPAGAHSFEHCYSLLPAIGDWQIFENFLVRRPDAESINSYNYMQAVRPLIPLEFNNGTAIYGTGYNFDHRGIQLSHRNGEIFGRGFRNIGKVSLLPAVFGENGTVQEFYLYISSDFQRDADSVQYDDWQNVVLGALGNDSLYGVMSEQVDTLTPTACLKSTDGRVLVPETGEWLTLSENNAHLFFDAFSCKGLLLDDNGAQLMLGDGVGDTQNIECRTLPQWIAPTGKIDAVTGEYVVASADNSAFCTSLVTGFNRQFISPNTISLTARAFLDSNENNYKLAIYEGVNENSRKIFRVNQILSQTVTPEAIQWQDIFLEPLSIQLLHSFESDSFSRISFMYGNNEGELLYNNDRKVFSIMPIFSCKTILTIAPITTEYSQEDHITYVREKISDTRFVYDGSDWNPYEYNRRYAQHGKDFAVPLKASVKIFFIHPETGQPSEYFDINMTCNYSFFTIEYDNKREYRIKTLEIPNRIFIKDGKIWWRFTVRDFSNYILAGEDSYIVKQVMDVPEQVKNWDNYADIYHAYEGVHSLEFPSTSLHFQHFFDNYAVFSERFSNSLFAQQINSMSLENILVSRFFEYPYILDKHVNEGAMITAKQNLHVISAWNVASQQYTVFVFRSQLNPDILDFYSEIERSKSQ